ncbi:MAG: M42 family peptidase, partial [Phycisphaeraceae bacterium]|nr:M42 family peptidase [Phycisphaeraceae bacterium]
MKLLEQLTTTPGVPGREDRVRNLILDSSGSLFDETSVDALGNLHCHRKPRPRHAATPSRISSDNPPTKVMLAAHMDQIGFLVRHIDDKGFLRIQNVGGFDTRNLFARLVTVCTNTGDLPGVLNPGGKPVHIASDEDRKKVPDISDLVVDLGLPPEVVKAKVSIGDMVVLRAGFTQVGNSVVAQCLDNRVACWIALRAIEMTPHHDCDIHVVFTTQEEVG